MHTYTIKTCDASLVQVKADSMEADGHDVSLSIGSEVIAFFLSPASVVRDEKPEE